jgi:hypothetical protein
MRLTSLKSVGRAALVAIALGSAAIVAAPAQAQSGPSLNFHIGPGGSGFSFGFGNNPNWNNNPGWNNHQNWGPGRWACFNDNQIRQYLQNNGWRNVQVGQNLGNNRVRATARWGNQWYEMRVNRCTGEVDRVRRINRGPGGGFGLQFN